MSEKDIEELKKVIKEAIHEELGTYKVDKEQHYQDHLFLRDLQEWYDDIRSSFWKSVVGAFVMAFLGLLLLGFIFWGKASFK
ncbi:MAG: hypothetical protein Q8P48_08640 [Deltaproteobacteria bacterium]|nr:hypothetical protein [Deltaproteobacteria bacterium]